MGEGERDQRVAVITGSSRGIGAGLVAAYRQRGWAVVSNAPGIRASADPGVLAVAGDIAAPGTPEAVIGGALDRFGRVDTLVNNAGVYISKPFTEYSAIPEVLTSLTKGGLAAATRSLAIEYASRGIRVNAVSRPALGEPAARPPEGPG